MAEYADNRLEDLLILAMDDKISSEQVKELNTLLRGQPERIREAVQFLQVASHLKQSRKLAGIAKPWLTSDSQKSLTAFMELMAKYEKTAETVQIEASSKAADRSLVRPVRVQSVRPPVSRFSIYTLIVSSAAMLCLIAYVILNPVGGQIETATLSDSIQAQWAPTHQGQLKNGARLTVRSGPIWLQNGLAELQFDNNARVLIEGPAEFEIIAEDRIGLEYGKIYTIVPPEAIGFSVYTRNAKVIDLGTEFGIEIDHFGNTLLHTIKGQTRLIAGLSSAPVSMEIGAGQAKKVCADTQSISDIPCSTDLFVRSIDSQTGSIWRGQVTVDLADIVGGGNGFGTGRGDYGINPVTGEPSGMETHNRLADNSYRISKQNPLVDGVFVPNGKNSQIISSLGHVFRECPTTQGIFFTEIMNTPGPLDGQTMSLNKTLYGSGGNPCIFMHANLGITFDLDAIRSRVPGLRTVKFQSVIGVSETAWRECNTDFWVLVDGQLRYKKERVQQTGLLDTVQIELSGTDRFLTLAVTDGGDPEIRELPDGFVRQSIDCDWGIFGSPVLILE
jgi:hypothetical protein